MDLKELGERAKQTYQALISGGSGGVSKERAAQLLSEWEAAHRAWLDASGIPMGGPVVTSKPPRGW